MSEIVTTAAESQFALAQREAKALAASALIPAAYQNNIPNVLIAMDVSKRIGASPLMVMQNLYIVHGRPAWSATFLIATVNACGKFSALRYETRGDDPFEPDYRVRAVALDKATGEACEGPWVGWRMVKAEGWDGKKGSKWGTMPDLMFRYRAAAFWTRLFAPEVSMGIYTADEVEDMGSAPQTFRRERVSADTGSALSKLLEGASASPVEALPVAAEPEPQSDTVDAVVVEPAAAQEPAHGDDAPDYTQDGFDFHGGA